MRGFPSAVRPDLVAAIAAIAAVFAPADLTGHPLVDAIERAVIAGFVTYVGAHGRRWAWLVAATAVVVPARELSLLLAVSGLAVVALAAIPSHRSRRAGALGLGLTVNAALWYPEGTAPWGVALAVAAMVIVVGSGLPHLRAPKRGVAQGLAAAAVVFTIVAGGAAVVAVGLSYRNVQSGASSAREALDSARDGDSEAASTSLDAASTSFATASNRVSGLLTVPAAFVPGLAQQVEAVQTTVDQGRHITAAADDLVATADYDGLKYNGGLDLKRVRDLAPPTARADVALDEARTQLAEVQAGWLLPPLQDRVDQFVDDIDEARADTALAADLLEHTPAMFGADEPRRYLIVFLTPAELRGAGGFVGSYGELELHDGHATLTRSGRIDDLIDGPNRGSRTISGPKDYLERYGRFDPAVFLQDATYSPNFPSDAKVLAELYPQAGGKPVDGVIAVDPKGLSALLKLTGPVAVNGLGQPLTSENAAEILTRSQYVDLGDRAARGEVQAEATRATFEKLINSSLPSPRTLSEALSPASRGGHLRLWSPDRGEQALFERLGADGSLVIPEGADGFSLIQQNSGNNKIDAYLKRTIAYHPTIDVRTGNLTAEMTVELTNAVPFAVLPEAVGGNTRGAPDGTNLTTLTLFTRNVVTEATIDGKPLTLGPSKERGLNAWDTPQFDIPPGATVTLVFQLQGGLDLSHGYHLKILPQPVANPDRFTSTLLIENGTVAATGDPGEQLFDDDPLEAPTSVHVRLDR